MISHIDDLKPCPFCGSTNFGEYWESEYLWNYTLYHKPNCFLYDIGVTEIYNDEIDKWNERFKEE